MSERINFADCYVLTHQRNEAFLQAFLNHFIPRRGSYATAFEVPQHGDPPEQVFTDANHLVTYLVNHPHEIHAIYWENKDTSLVRAAMLLFTSDGQVIVGLTTETNYPDASIERQHLQQLEIFCNSSFSLIEYDTPAAKDTADFLKRIKDQRNC